MMLVSIKAPVLNPCKASEPHNRTSSGAGDLSKAATKAPPGPRLQRTWPHNCRHQRITEAPRALAHDERSTCTYVYIYISVYVCACMYVCMHACMHVCMYVCVCTYIYTENICICIYICICVCIFTSIYIHIYICAYMYIQMYALGTRIAALYVNVYTYVHLLIDTHCICALYICIKHVETCGRALLL